jgi:anti-sigma-K factor RskA
MMSVNEDSGMSDEVHVLESLPAYALGALDETEAKDVRFHLAGCLICRTELQSYEGVAWQLALAGPDTAGPPPELKGRLLERVGRLQRAANDRPASASRGWLRLRPVWGVAAALLILSLTLVNFLLWQRVNNQEVLTGPQGIRAITLYGTEAAPQAGGFIIMGGDGQNGVLVVDEMPQLEPEWEYQLWLIREAESVSGAVFAVDETGYRGVRIESPESLHLYSAVRVTIEPAAGSPQPTGEAVMTGLLPRP